METLATCINGINGDQHGLENIGGTRSQGEIDIHTAARHGTPETVDRLMQLAGAGEDVRQLRRGAVESTPAHDAAATGNIPTLIRLLGSHPCPV